LNASKFPTNASGKYIRRLQDLTTYFRPVKMGRQHQNWERSTSPAGKVVIITNCRVFTLQSLIPWLLLGASQKSIA
jgi:hypothetical protein